MHTRALPPRLIALSAGTLAGPRQQELLARLGAAVSAGLRGLLLREPGLGDRDFLDLARRARRALDPAQGGWLGLHDRPHLVSAAGADGVHVGFRSLRPAELRPWIGADVAVGLSTHAGDDPAEWADADYLFHGPVAATPSKAGLLEPIGGEGLARGVAAASCPVWAIGGLAAGDVGRALEAGARGVAVLSGILPSEDPGRATRAYLEALGDPPGRGAGPAGSMPA